MQHPYPVILFLLFSAGLAAQCPDLVWSDEFDGDTLDLNNWTYEIGDGCDRGICGWGNQELQSYQEENTTVSDGTLKITARPEVAGNSSYTSSRLISRNKQDFTYGRIEARIKVPGGNGTWPAFWMLSTDEVYGGWPQSGEIDIMEYVGKEPNQVLGTIHYGKPYPLNRYNTGRIDFDSPLYDDFHEFAVEWEEDTIRWMVDDILFHTQTPSDLNGENWPFDQDFFIILNLAVGGTLGGAVDPAAFPATMEVDYVRVYGSNRPYITGERNVESRASGTTYSIGNLSDEVGVTWTVPQGATIVSGQGTPTLTLDWGTQGGTVSAATVLACGEQTLALDVTVAPGFGREFALENFDDEALLTYTFSTGTLTEGANPAPDSVNGSALSGTLRPRPGEPNTTFSFTMPRAWGMPPLTPTATSASTWTCIPPPRSAPRSCCSSKPPPLPTPTTPRAGTAGTRPPCRSRTPGTACNSTTSTAPIRTPRVRGSRN